MCGTPLTSIDRDSVAIIFTFLSFRDAVGFCLVNKEAYRNYAETCCATSFLSINLQKIPRNFLKKNYRHINAMSQLSKWKELPHDVVPSKLVHLEFSKKFNQPLDQRANKMIPTTVEHIKFDARSKFNFSINMFSTLNLKRIYFNKSFNKSIDNLPDSVELISFHKNSKFNKHVRRWPNSLRELHLGESFNQPIDSVPDSVEVLMFSNFSKFNCDVIKCPISLKKIHFGEAFNRDISALTHTEHLSELLFYKKSHFNQPIGTMPDSIIKISFGAHFNQSIDTLANLNNIKHIYFCLKSAFNMPIHALPSSVRYIHFGRDFNSELCALPPSIRHIKFRTCSKFNHIILVSDRLDILYLGRNFSSVVCCSNIKKLKVNGQVYFNIKIPMGHSFAPSGEWPEYL